MDSKEIFMPLSLGGCQRRGKGDGCRCAEDGGDAMAGWSLAMVYSPEQPFCDIYEADEGLSRGTIFAALDKPFYGDGRGCGC